MHILVTLSALFKALMIIDAMRRGGCCNNQWYFIIVFVPFGEWAYFFMVKIHDPEFAQMRKAFVRGPRLQDYQAHYDHCPSPANRLRLAQALVDAGLHGEAKDHFAALHESDPRDKSFMLGLGISLQGLQEWDRACEVLGNIVEQDFAFKDFLAAETLIESHWQAGKRDESLKLLEKTIKRSGRTAHRLMLARYLLDLDRLKEAKELVNAVVNEYKVLPGYAKRNGRYDLRCAKALQRALERRA